MIHSFLLIGQSNMAGRGYLNEAEEIQNPNLKVLRNGRWLKMFRPVNPDRSVSGVCLAESFADAYSKEHNVEVGLIPCADGGTKLAQWAPGTILYDNAVFQAKLAQRTSTIAGVLWHQGEGDCREELYGVYTDKLLEMVRAMKSELNLYDVPFLCGGLGEYLKDYDNPTIKYYYEQVTDAIKTATEKEPMMGFVSAKGLTPNPDNLHFNTKSLMEFGLRYYEVFKTLEDKNKVFVEKSEDTYRTALELL